MSTDWDKKELWRKRGENFLIEVSRHGEQIPGGSGCFDEEGPHRWCVYAYIYPKHPHFAEFDGSDDMWQDAAVCLPLHGGPSFLRAHVDRKTGAITAYQVGADYHHLGDDCFTRMETADDAHSVFADAQALFDRLSISCATGAKP